MCSIFFGKTAVILRDYTKLGRLMSLTRNVKLLIIISNNSMSNNITISFIFLK